MGSSAAREFGAHVARHRLDLRCDCRYNVQALRIRVLRGRGRVKPVDVGQEHEAVGRYHAGDARGEPVVVAVADFGSGHGVVLVHDRDRAQLEQRLDGVPGVQVAAPLLGVARRHQDLRGCEPLPGEHRLIGVGAPA